MSVDACAESVAKSDPDRFAAALTAPLQVRADLIVLYAFNAEVARAPWVTDEPMLAEMRLQWWRDAVEEIYTDKAVRQHEVTTPLAEMLRRRQLPRKKIDAMIDARRWELAREGLDDLFKIEALLKDSSGIVMELSACISAESTPLGPAGRAAARHLGMAEGMAAIVQAFPELKARGNIPSIVHCTANWMHILGDAGRVSYMKAREKRKALPRATLPALLSAVRAEPILIRANRRPEAAFSAPLVISDARVRFRRLIQGTTGNW